MPIDYDDFKWFHVILSTYGSWLPGDPRGFRTRKHKLHVEGDYKNPPPPDAFQGLQQSARNAMKRDSVTLGPDHKVIVSNALRETLHDKSIRLASSAVAARHAHLLAELHPDETRDIVGAAKRNAWFRLRDEGWKTKLWAKRPKFIPIEDWSHWRNSYRYILRHESEGAVVWEWEHGGDYEPTIVPPGAAGGL